MLQCILGKNWRSARYYAVRHFFSGWTSPRSMRNRWFSRHFENRDNTIVTVIDHVGWWTTAPIRTRTITKDDQIIKFIQSFTSSSASFHSSVFTSFVINQKLITAPEYCQWLHRNWSQNLGPMMLGTSSRNNIYNARYSDGNSPFHLETWNRIIPKYSQTEVTQDPTENKRR